MFLFIMHGIMCGLSQLQISHMCMVCYKLRAFILPITGQCFTHLFDHNSDRMFSYELSFAGLSIKKLCMYPTLLVAHGTFGFKTTHLQIENINEL